MPSEGPFQIAQRSNSISRWSGQVVTVTKLAVKFLNRAKLPEPAIPLRVHTVRHTAARVPVCHAPGDLEPLRARDRGNCRRCCRNRPRRRRELIPGRRRAIDRVVARWQGRTTRGRPTAPGSRRGSFRTGSVRRHVSGRQSGRRTGPGRRLRCRQVVGSVGRVLNFVPEILQGAEDAPARLAGAVMRIRNLRYCSSRRRRRSGSRGSIRGSRILRWRPHHEFRVRNRVRGVSRSQSGPGQSCTEDGQTCQGQRDCAATFGHESDGPLS